MFTGIVEELGTVIDSRPVTTEWGAGVRLRIAASTVLEGSGLGASIAVNGCCLTVVARSVDTLEFEQWLQWIFLPRMKMILEQDLPLPNASGIQEMAEMVFASRNLGGKDRQLQVLLKEFDLLISTSR